MDKKKLVKTFTYGFWWGLDFHAYVLLVSFLAISLPGAFISSYFAVGDIVRTILLTLYLMVLYAAFMGKLIYYYHFKDTYNELVRLGGNADKKNLLDIFFNELKKEIVPFLKKIQEKKKSLKEENKIDVPVDEDIQFKFAKYLANYVGFDFEKGIIETSEHPFTLNLNKNDVRLTTNNKKDTPFSTVFSIIHEAGHGIYEQQTGDELIDTLLGTGGTMGLHESQSRFMENIVGRNKSFWKPLYKKAQEFYPFLKDIDFEEFSKQINKIEPGLIRVEADELTYSLHIMVRYEIEKMIFAGEVSIDDLPKIWNQKMVEYLGMEPKNDSEGLMQDVHWYCGLVGYFPSYAIGSAYASQIYNTMKKDFDVDKALENQDIKKITDWLGEKIHKYGRLKDTAEIIKKVTGEELNPKYYIDYLKEKYSKIYEI